MNALPESQRQVFRYFDGRSVAFADPLRVHRRMVAALDGDPQVFLRQYNSDDPQTRSDATERLVPAVLLAFELPPFDRTTGEGLLEGDALRILRAFLEWMSFQKKTPENSPISSPSSAPPSFAAGPSPTPTSSASSSTSGGCGCS